MMVNRNNINKLHYYELQQFIKVVKVASMNLHVIINILSHLTQHLWINLTWLATSDFTTLQALVFCIEDIVEQVLSRF